MLTRYLARRRAIARLSLTIPRASASVFASDRADFMRAAFAARASRYLIAMGGAA
jgi:hypothetical protein